MMAERLRLKTSHSLMTVSNAGEIFSAEKAFA